MPLVDSSSARFSFKSAVAAEIGALVAWMVFNAGRVGGLVFNDQRIDSIAPLRSRNRTEAVQPDRRVEPNT